MKKETGEEEREAERRENRIGCVEDREGEGEYTLLQN